MSITSISTSSNSTTIVKQKEILKLICIGDIGTGKTSFVNRVIKDEFNYIYQPTLSLDNFTKEYQIKGKPVIVSLADVPGDSRYFPCFRGFAKGCSGVFIFVDSSNPVRIESTMKGAEKWKENLDDLFKDIPVEIPVVLLVNKVDLDPQSIVEKKNIQYFESFKKDKNIKKVFFTSSMTNLNIENAMSYIIDEAWKYKSEIPLTKDGIVDIAKLELRNSKKCCAIN
eukprot:gene7931-9757_t